RFSPECAAVKVCLFAAPAEVEFRKVEPAASYYAAGTNVRMLWAELYYRNLVRHYVDEILEDRPQECTFYDGAKSQEIVDAIITAHFERRWVDIPGGRA